jgi:hypothetical protein
LRALFDIRQGGHDVKIDEARLLKGELKREVLAKSAGLNKK